MERLIAAVDLAEAGESDADNDHLRLDWEKADLAQDTWLVHAPITGISAASPSRCFSIPSA